MEDKKIISLNSNIIRWYEFDSNSNVLIIGDRFGELTKYLSDKVNKITLIDKKVDNSNGVFNTAVNSKNITVINDAFENVELIEKFSYIIMLDCISYKNDEKMNVSILKKAQSLLKENGTILLVTQNLLSLKFLSELDYNNYEMRGMTKFGLEKLFIEARLSEYKFYYPLPDSNIANAIFTDYLLPNCVSLDRNIDLKQEIEKRNFNDRKILAEIAENSKYDFKYYCSSFLVEIGKSAIDSDVRAVYYNNVRQEEFRLITKILDNEVVKYTVENAGKKHIENIANNVKILNDLNINTLDSFDGEKIISKYVVNAVTLQDLFLDNYQKGNFGEIGKIVERYKNEILSKLQSVDKTNNIFEKYNINISEEKLGKLNFVKYGLWDLTFPNIFVINNEFFAYDQEWFENNVPSEFILYRCIKYLSNVTEEDKNKLYEIFELSEFLSEFLELELSLQDGLLDKEVFQCYVNSVNSYKDTATYVQEIITNELEEKDREILQYKNELIQEQNQRKKDEKEIEFRQGLVDSKEMVNSYVSQQLQDFVAAYNHVNKEISKLQKELRLKNEEVRNIVNSQQFIQGAISLKRREQLYPVIVTVRGVKKGINKIFKPIKSAIIAIVRKIGKVTYDNYPIKSHKRKLKNKFLYSDKLAKIGNVQTYKDYCSDNIDLMLMEDGTVEKCVKFQVGLNKTIGIHLHLYYEDLLEEFYEYFCNIPYVFDLYVSVMKGANVKQIYKKFNQILNVNIVKVVETPNSGRDFGAMFVEFREDLKQHDYIMHVHTKKSLRMGSEQTEWRRYMLDNLLGSTPRIMKCFYLMEQMNMGMVYVDTMSGPAPYWAHNWLGEAPLAREVLSRIGLEFKDEFLQFPAGSMFWAKKDAIHQLFNINWTWEEFGYETKDNNEQNLAYVFERITGKVARHNGYDLAIYNPEEHRYRKNKGVELLNEYYCLNKDNVTNMLMRYDLISFDIFDTLITRNIYKPDDSFEIISNRIKNKNINLDNYFELRKQAEFNVRKNKNFKGDCNIHEIYEEFENLTDLSHEEVNFVKETEINVELELAIPRYDMLEIYNKLLQNNKKIVLVSDMYLCKDIIEKILNKCGYYNWFELMVSADVGKRKDNETMWEYFFDKYNDCKTIHIGDSEYSDIHAVAKKGKTNMHVFKGTKLNTLMEQRYVEENEKLNLAESVMMGSIINRVICNSPFALNDIDNHSVINSYYDFGYAVLGPVIFNYILWLIKESKKSDKKEVLLFAAREGYYLQKIYNIFKDKLGNFENLEDHYLYISRRAITVMGIETIEDVREIMEMSYSGTIREVLYYRLNYKENNFKDEIIELPRDIDKVMKIVTENFQEILKNAQKEKEGYFKYLDSLNIDFENDKVTMLDLGYAGTSQYYLSKLLNKKIDGKYFVVQSKLKPVKLGCDVYSCYNKNIYSSKIDCNLIYKNSLFLETFLTAPDGQFLYMDIENDECIPRFLHEPNKKEQMEKLDKVYQGVKEFTETLLNLLGEKIFDYEIDRKYIYRCYEICLKESYKFDDNMKSLFLIEDYYCSNSVLNGFEVFKHRNKDWNYE